MTNIANSGVSAGRVTILWLWLWLASGATVAASALATIVAYGGFSATMAADAWRDAARIGGDVTASINVLVYIVTAVLVLRWVHRSTAIACAASDRMVVTPGWAVGRFFIPILNLWRPFQGVAETWRATANPAAPDDVPTPAILYWWWGLWLTTSLFGHIDGRLARTPVERLDAGWADLLLFALNVPLVVVLVRIVTQMSAMQRALLTRQADAIDEDHAS